MNNIIAIACLCAWAALPAASLAQEQPVATSGNHIGTWQLILTKRGDAKEFSDFPQERRRLKLLTPTHYSMVDYDVKTKRIVYSTGGPYTLREGVYTETIEFANDAMKSYLDKLLTFTVKIIDGDLLVQKGKLSESVAIEEVWRRVK